MEKTPWLHIVPQASWHGEASISGTREGLEAIRDAINAALETGEAEASVFATDGEGYGVTVTRCRTTAALGRPYYADEASREMARFEIEFHAKHYSKPRPTFYACKTCQDCGARTTPTPKEPAA